MRINHNSLVKTVEYLISVVPLGIFYLPLTNGYICVCVCVSLSWGCGVTFYFMAFDQQDQVCVCVYLIATETGACMRCLTRKLGNVLLFIADVVS